MTIQSPIKQSQCHQAANHQSVEMLKVSMNQAQINDEYNQDDPLKSNMITFCGSSYETPIYHDAATDSSIFMEHIDHMLVEYMCQQTAPSTYRLAGETLAKSNLNPNAKEFRPKVPPKTDCFVSQGHIVNNRQLDEAESSEKYENCHGAMTTNVSCMGEINLIYSYSHSTSSFSETTLKVALDECGTLSTESKSVMQMTSNLLPSVTQFEPFKTDGVDSEVCFDSQPRQRSISSSSLDSDSLSRNLSECSDDSYIQFDTRSDVKVSEKGAESENYMYTKLLKAKALELRISSDFEEDEIEDLSDEEGFDEICFEEDLLGLQSPLRVENLIHPNSIQLRDVEDDLKQVLKQKNTSWNEETMDIKRKSEVKVRFSDDPDLVVYEPANLVKSLKQARISDFKRRQADLERLERVLSPVLTQEHRAKIYKRFNAS